MRINLRVVLYSLIIIILTIALVVVYYLGIVKNEEKISDLEKKYQETIDKNNEKISELEKKYQDVKGQLENDYNVADDKKKKFVSLEPKISFEYPSDWNIKTNNWNVWNRTVEESQENIRIIIQKEENEEKKELKDLISLDFGSKVLDEGTLNINNYQAYYKEYTFGDADYLIKGKEVVINAGEGKYYSVSFIVEEDEKSSKDEKYEKYESVLSDLLLSIQF